MLCVVGNEKCHQLHTRVASGLSMALDPKPGCVIKGYLEFLLHSV